MHSRIHSIHSLNYMLPQLAVSKKKASQTRGRENCNSTTNADNKQLLLEWKEIIRIQNKDQRNIKVSAQKMNLNSNCDCTHGHMHTQRAQAPHTILTPHLMECNPTISLYSCQFESEKSAQRKNASFVRYFER